MIGNAPSLGSRVKFGERDRPSWHWRRLWLLPRHGACEQQVWERFPSNRLTLAVFSEKRLTRMRLLWRRPSRSWRRRLCRAAAPYPFVSAHCRGASTENLLRQNSLPRKFLPAVASASPGLGITRPPARAADTESGIGFVSRTFFATGVVFCLCARPRIRAAFLIAAFFIIAPKKK